MGALGDPASYEIDCCLRQRDTAQWHLRLSYSFKLLYNYTAIGFARYHDQSQVSTQH